MALYGRTQLPSRLPGARAAGSISAPPSAAPPRRCLTVQHPDSSLQASPSHLPASLRSANMSSQLPSRRTAASAQQQNARNNNISSGIPSVSSRRPTSASSNSSRTSSRIATPLSVSSSNQSIRSASSVQPSSVAAGLSAASSNSGIPAMPLGSRSSTASAPSSAVSSPARSAGKKERSQGSMLDKFKLFSSTKSSRASSKKEADSTTSKSRETRSRDTAGSGIAPPSASKLGKDPARSTKSSSKNSLSRSSVKSKTTAESSSSRMKTGMREVRSLSLEKDAGHRIRDARSGRPPERSGAQPQRSGSQPERLNQSRKILEPPMSRAEHSRRSARAARTPVVPGSSRLPTGPSSAAPVTQPPPPPEPEAPQSGLPTRSSSSRSKPVAVVKGVKDSNFSPVPTRAAHVQPDAVKGDCSLVEKLSSRPMVPTRTTSIAACNVSAVYEPHSDGIKSKGKLGESGIGASCQSLGGQSVGAQSLGAQSLGGVSINSTSSSTSSASAGSVIYKPNRDDASVMSDGCTGVPRSPHTGPRAASVGHNTSRPVQNQQLTPGSPGPMDETDESLDIKPMKPIERPSPYAYLQLRTPTRGRGGLPRFSSYRMLTQGGTGTPVEASRKDSQGRALDIADVELAGYMSDGDALRSGPSSARGGYRAGFSSRYHSDVDEPCSGYMSEGGAGAGVYAKRLQQRLREGMMECARNQHAFEDNSNSSFSSGEINDLIADVTADELGSTNLPTRDTSTSKPAAISAAAAVPQIKEANRASSPVWKKQGGDDLRSETPSYTASQPPHGGASCYSSTDRPRRSSLQGREFSASSAMLPVQNALPPPAPGGSLGRSRDGHRRTLTADAVKEKLLSSGLNQAPQNSAGETTGLGSPMRMRQHTRGLTTGSLPLTSLAYSSPGAPVAGPAGGYPSLASLTAENPIMTQSMWSKTSPTSPNTAHLQASYWSDSEMLESHYNRLQRPDEAGYRPLTAAVHRDLLGSRDSLQSSHSSAYSSVQEARHLQETLQLRRELESAQAKVTTLTNQLSNNANVVSAFEHNLMNMSERLQFLMESTVRKDSELADLRGVIDDLRVQIPREPSVPPSPGGSDVSRRSVGRQMSEESLNSLGSMSSAASSQQHNPNEPFDSMHRRKKKGWIRSSLTKAFTRRKSKGSLSDVESDVSSSPQHLLPVNVRAVCSPNVMRTKRPHGYSSAGALSDTEECLGSRSRRHGGRDRERRLTDVRIDAISSARQLQQLRDAMEYMKNEMSLLKADNERLQMIIHTTETSPASTAQKQPVQADVHRSLPHRGSASYAELEKRLSLAADPTPQEMTSDAKRIRVSVLLGPPLDAGKTQATTQLPEYLIGSLPLGTKTSWQQLDTAIRKLFRDYVLRVDPASNLGLNSDSVYSYHIGDIVRKKEGDLPELLPYGYLVGEHTTVRVGLRAALQHSVDALAFATLIPKAVIQRYVSLLMEHRRVVLCGPPGTGKSHLATRLAQYLVVRSGRILSPFAIKVFSVEQRSARELREFLTTLTVSGDAAGSDKPAVVILENLHLVKGLADVFEGALTSKFQQCPYLIGTMHPTSSNATNLQIHHNFRWVLLGPQLEPVKGMLGRFLRRRVVQAEVIAGGHMTDVCRVIEWLPKVWNHINKFLEAHNSPETALGPKLFMTCPMDAPKARTWFCQLWNGTVHPYLAEVAKQGIKTNGCRGQWEDPTEWVMESLPWDRTDTAVPLKRLKARDVGLLETSGASHQMSRMMQQPSPVPEERHEDDGPSNDPVVTMLQRLQQATGRGHTPSPPRNPK